MKKNALFIFLYGLAVAGLGCVGQARISEDSDCTTQDDCAGGKLCIDKRCVSVCNQPEDCPTQGEACINGACVEIEGSECSNNEECTNPSACRVLEGARCRAGLCEYLPEEDLALCPLQAGLFGLCLEGTCVQCIDSHDCPGPQATYPGCFDASCETHACVYTPVPDRVCVNVGCTNGVISNERTCGVTGSCPFLGDEVECNGYACEDSDTCRTSCSSNDHCVSTHFCDIDTCVLKLEDGQPCDDAGQCVSGTCKGSCGAECPSASHLCLPEFDVDWEGPLAVHVGSAQAAQPECTGEYAQQYGQMYQGLNPGEASCETCECNDATGIVCRVTLNGHGNTDCSGCSPSCLCAPPCMTFPSLINNECAKDLSALSGYAARRSNNAGVHDPGSCTPKKLTPDVMIQEPPSWDHVITLCSDPTFLADGCDINQLCTPLPPQQDGWKVCIAREGNVACPEGVFAEKHVFHPAYDDHRTCSNCSCGSASSTCSGGQVHFWESDDCEGDWPTHTVNAATCTNDAAALAAGSAVYLQGSASGSCNASGGVLTNTVTEKAFLTVCCLEEI